MSFRHLKLDFQRSDLMQTLVGHKQRHCKAVHSDVYSIGRRTDSNSDGRCGAEGFPRGSHADPGVGPVLSILTTYKMSALERPLK